MAGGASHTGRRGAPRERGADQPLVHPTEEDVVRRLTAAADVQGVRIDPMRPDDVHDLHALVGRNAEHLAADYGDLVACAPGHLFEHLVPDDGSTTTFVIRMSDDPVGIVSIGHVDPPRYSIGYWQDRAVGGRGIATAACAQAVLFAQERWGATDVYAGVTHGNAPSERLLARLGFTPVGDHGSYTRFHLPLDGGPPREPPAPPRAPRG